jgi:hypothetical protein
MNGLRSLAQENRYLYNTIINFSVLIHSICCPSHNVHYYASILHMQVRVKLHAQQRESPDNKALLATILQLATFELTLLIHEVLTDYGFIADHSYNFSNL